MTFTRQGQVPTPIAAQLLPRLCRHFAKKAQATWDEQAGLSGQADFPFGRCTLRADHTALHFHCSAPDAEALARLCSVLEIHVGMFSRRDPLPVRWT